MLINEYQTLAMRTNDELNTTRIMNALENFVLVPGSPDTGDLLNGALGLTGEAGEVADIIKKHIFHGHDLDTDALIKEIGDVCWYIALLCTAIGESMESVMKKNIEKLKTRYPEGFSSEASINRVV